MNETLTFTVMDYNTRQKDSELGAASFELHGLLEDAMQEEVIRPVLKDGKERGEVKVAM
jgi:Ca2+-dependent lipid-binding protein